MTVKRQDAWTAEDDMILAEVILRYIREGGTQLAAFEEVAQKLGRTPAACGFRWNSSVRKKYEAAIQIAKKQRQKRNQERRNAFSEQDLSSDSSYTIDHIIRFLRQHKNEMNELRRQQKQLEQELEERERQLRELEEENNQMKNQLNSVQNDYQLVNDDFRTLLKIMERARKLTLFEEENDGAKFQIEENGSLERVE